ncbi:restriction endonuclease subunit S [Phaeodactylibacter xiamenensis]|uniref:restriction endonuclease subunit S n=1 Tax=Phaeodactylibacter xiamenensis TaxID=1524460 RepID=UPI0024A7DA37|nr:restriction endonuclease subunit S [Phaeodactylibacter xiamenensis]
MAETVEKIQLKNIDQSDWQSFRFDEIAQKISERVDPAATDLEVYVGLEHLDPDSIHIRRKGKPTDVKGEKLRCYPGDVIFGKRRAYQRKAALIDFHGICSAHSFIFRAIPEIIDPKLFPFFLHSDQFMHRAVDISVGGLSPTINWRELKHQEFLLPPKDQQAQIAELLWAMDEVVEGKVQIVENLSLLKKSKLKDVFNRKVCDKVKVGDISENLDNKRIPIAKSKRIKGTTPYYGASGIVDYVEGHTHDEPILLISEDGENLNSRKLPIAYEVDGKSWINNHAHVLRITRASRYLVKEYFNFADVSDYITGGTRPKITKGMLTVMPIYLPKSGLEAIAEHRLVSIDYSITSCKQYIMKAKSLQKSLINQIF